VNIRKFVVRAGRLAELMELGTLTGSAAAFLEASVAAGLNACSATRRRTAHEELETRGLCVAMPHGPAAERRTGTLSSVVAVGIARLQPLLPGPFAPRVDPVLELVRGPSRRGKTTPASAAGPNEYQTLALVSGAPQLELRAASAAVVVAAVVSSVMWSPMDTATAAPSSSLIGAAAQAAGVTTAATRSPAAATPMLRRSCLRRTGRTAVLMLPPV
jgi:hypothetical protein